MRILLKPLIVGTIFTIIICFIVSYAELVITYIQIGFLQLPPAAIGVFFFLVIINRLFRKFFVRFGLSSQELMMIYCMMLVASMISSRGVMEKLIPALVAVNYFANDSNGWEELFFSHIKPWLVPFDPAGKKSQPTAVNFYERLEPGAAIPWGPWLKPLMLWGLLIVLILFGFLCLASILRKQWVDNEKLSFPLVQLPLEFVGDSDHSKGTGSFFKIVPMWVGFSIPALVFTLNGLHLIFPVVPHFDLSRNLNQYFTERPWNVIYYTPMFLSFAAIGFFYLLPAQLLFSLWFFFIFTRVQDVIASAFGMRISGMPLYPTHLYIAYQVAGAYMVLVGYFIYVSLPYLKRVFRHVFLNEKLDDSEELIPYKYAVWGLILSLIASAVWCAFGGLNLYFGLFEMLVYMLLVAIIMARSTSEGGLLMTETSFRPIDLYALVSEKSALGPTNLTFLSFFDAIFTRDQRGLVLTAFLDGLKISDGVGMRRRKLLVVFPVAIFVALITSALIHLWLPYSHGANFMYSYTYRGNPIWAFQNHGAAMEGASSSTGWVGSLFFLVGIAFTSFLAFMRTLFWWWPFHPIGYALGASWTLIVFWFDVLIAWAIKYPIMRYWGLRQYQKAKPFFLGLIFGEFSMAVLWTLISWAFHVPAPFFPWP